VVEREKKKKKALRSAIREYRSYILPESDKEGTKGHDHGLESVIEKKGALGEGKGRVGASSAAIL